MNEKEQEELVKQLSHIIIDKTQSLAEQLTVAYQVLNGFQTLTTVEYIKSIEKK